MSASNPRRRVRDIASQPLRALGRLNRGDLSLVRSLCDQVLILRQGEVVEQGEAAATPCQYA